MVRTKRMVGPVEDKEEENVFCGPPGKLNHDQSILTLVGVPTEQSRMSMSRANVG